MGTDRSPGEFRYISSRLVRQIVQQDQGPRSRWSISTFGFRNFGFQKHPIDYSNDFLLCREATEAVRNNTGTVAHPGQYIQTELDLTMGLMTVLMGWTDPHVEIAAMKAEVNDPEAGKVLVALFGSASNYTGRKPVSDGLAEYPSDVDGLYGILDRTRESGDPKILDEELDRDLGHDPNGRVDTAVRVLERFKGFGEGRFEVLMKCFCEDANTKPYDLVILGAPVWVRTPEPGAMGVPADGIG
jgi:hypothetical protein